MRNILLRWNERRIEGKMDKEEERRKERRKNDRGEGNDTRNE